MWEVQERGVLMRGRKPSAKEKQKALQMWLTEKKAQYYVAKKFKVHRKTMWEWKKRWDGTVESLENKSSRPKTPHPTSQTDVEKESIQKIIEDNPTWGYTEVYGELRTQFAYSRHYLTMYKFIRHNIIQEIVEDYVAKPYHTPEMIGQKWQMDVKNVHKECHIGRNSYKYKETSKAYHYQYTILDEASRERFIYPYYDHTAESTVDFIKRAIVHFGYVPLIIQTDNGNEFVNCEFSRSVKKLKVLHQRIKVRTPRHNGKVERSQGTDQRKFYKYLQYSTFEELEVEMSKWLIRYNKMPSTVLRDRYGKRVFQSPLEKRAELIELLKESEYADKFEVRFVKTA